MISRYTYFRGCNKTGFAFTIFKGILLHPRNRALESQLAGKNSAPPVPVTDCLIGLNRCKILYLGFNLVASALPEETCKIFQTR